MFTLDPFHKIDRILLPISIMVTEKHVHVRIEEDKRKLLASDSSLMIQVRAMKMDSKVRYMVKFPDK